MKNPDKLLQKLLITIIVLVSVTAFKPYNQETSWELMLDFDTGDPDYQPVVSDFTRMRWPSMPPTSCNALVSQGGLIPDNWGASGLYAPELTYEPTINNTYMTYYYLRYEHDTLLTGFEKMISGEFELDVEETITAFTFYASSGTYNTSEFVVTVCDDDGLKTFQSHFGAFPENCQHCTAGIPVEGVEGKEIFLTYPNPDINQPSSMNIDNIGITVQALNNPFDEYKPYYELVDEMIEPIRPIDYYMGNNDISWEAGIINDEYRYMVFDAFDYTSDVLAPVSGIVRYVRQNEVVIEADSVTQTMVHVMGFTNKAVEPGQTVVQGCKLGTVGNSGYTRDDGSQWNVSVSISRFDETIKTGILEPINIVTFSQAPNNNPSLSCDVMQQDCINTAEWEPENTVEHSRGGGTQKGHSSVGILYNENDEIYQEIILENDTALEISFDYLWGPFTVSIGPWESDEQVVGLDEYTWTNSVLTVPKFPAGEYEIVFTMGEYPEMPPSRYSATKIDNLCVQLQDSSLSCFTIQPDSNSSILASGDSYFLDPGEELSFELSIGESGTYSIEYQAGALGDTGNDNTIDVSILDQSQIEIYTDTDNVDAPIGGFWWSDYLHEVSLAGADELNITLTAGSGTFDRVAINKEVCYWLSSEEILEVQSPCDIEHGCIHPNESESPSIFRSLLYWIGYIICRGKAWVDRIVCEIQRIPQQFMMYFKRLVVPSDSTLIRLAMLRESFYDKEPFGTIIEIRDAIYEMILLLAYANFNDFNTVALGGSDDLLGYLEENPPATDGSLTDGGHFEGLENDTCNFTGLSSYLGELEVGLCYFMNLLNRMGVLWYLFMMFNLALVVRLIIVVRRRLGQSL